MSTQQHKQPGNSGGGGDDFGGPAPAAPQVNTSSIDSMLDEIDDVLESNASEFVSGFVQKGGQ